MVDSFLKAQRSTVWHFVSELSSSRTHVKMLITNLFVSSLCHLLATGSGQISPASTLISDSECDFTDDELQLLNHFSYVSDLDSRDVLGLKTSLTRLLRFSSSFSLYRSFSSDWWRTKKVELSWLHQRWRGTDQSSHYRNFWCCSYPCRW